MLFGNLCNSSLYRNIFSPCVLLLEKHLFGTALDLGYGALDAALVLLLALVARDGADRTLVVVAQVRGALAEAHT